MLYSVQVSHKEKSFEQDWEAWKSFTEVTPICIWKDEGRCHRRRKAPQEGGIAHARVWRGGKAWQPLCGQNVEIEWQEIGLFVRLEQAKSLKRGFYP